MPLHTCAFVIVQSPVITPPTWSQVPARAAGVSARSAAKSPPRATDQTMRRVRALACRSVALDIRRPPHVEASGYPLGNETGGHDSLPIRDRFLKRFSDDYPTRYVSVLTSENIGVVRERDFHIESWIKIGSIARKAAVPTPTITPGRKRHATRPPIASVARLSQVRRTAVQGRIRIRGLRCAINRRHVRAPLDLVGEVSIGMAVTGFAILRKWPPRSSQPRLSRTRSRRTAMLVPLGIIALSIQLSFNWRGNPPGFRPDAVPIILSGLAVGFIIVVASWGASRPGRACPACGGRLPGSTQVKKCPYCGHLFA